MEPAKATHPVSKIATCLSALCAVHCVLTGLALWLLSVSGLGILSNPWLEAAFLGSAAALGAWALWHGVKRHHSWIPAAGFAAGIAAIAASHFAFGLTGGFGRALGTSLAVVGGLSVAAFNVLNARLQHKGCSCRSVESDGSARPAAAAGEDSPARAQAWDACADRVA